MSGLRMGNNQHEARHTQVQRQSKMMMQRSFLLSNFINRFNLNKDDRVWSSLRHMQIQDQSIKNEDLSFNRGMQREKMEEEYNTQEMEVGSHRSLKREKQEYMEKCNKIIDLNAQSFEGIVMHCRTQGLISQEMAHCFFFNHSSTVDKKFIDLYRSEQLHLFDFNKYKISIFDHRKLVGMLLKNHPEKYIPFDKPERPKDFLPEVREFLAEIYAYPAQYYDTYLEKLINEHYQSWWGGPKYISPVVDPPVRFCETEEGKKLREDRENTIRIESAEEEKERMRRISQQRATNADLIDIAKMVSAKLYGNKPKEPEPKIEAQEESMNESAGSTSSKASKKKKEKKDKKEKREKKSKKKDKKHKEDESVKMEEESVVPAPSEKKSSSRKKKK